MAPRLRFLTDDRIVDFTSTSAKLQTIEVICAGLPRCATSSLQAALEGPVLGISPCMHMAHVVPHADRMKLVLEAMALVDDTERRRELLGELFAGYRASADFPGTLFVDDLMDMYPDAAIILNTRPNAASWVKSFSEGIGFFRTPLYKYICLLWETDRLHYQLHIDVQKMKFAERKLGIDVDIVSEEFYTAFNAWVRHEAKKRGRRVLEWQARDGLAPVCEFLGKPVPTPGTPEAVLPHVNDARMMQMLKVIIVARGVVSWAVVGGLGWALWRFGGRWLMSE